LALAGITFTTASSSSASGASGSTTGTSISGATRALICGERGGVGTGQWSFGAGT
jgi:hypothetical protein